MGQTKPIRPEEIAGKKGGLFPDFVIDAFNELIAKNYSGGKSKVLTKDVVALIMLKGDIENRSMIYDEKWLDVEEIFEEWWDVSYERPVAYAGEKFDAYFLFTEKGKR